MGAVLFDGYDDALLSAAHSGIVTLISNIWNGGVNIIPIPVPDMHTMAYFNGVTSSPLLFFVISHRRSSIIILAMNRIGFIRV